MHRPCRTQTLVTTFHPCVSLVTCTWLVVLLLPFSLFFFARFSFSFFCVFVVLFLVGIFFLVFFFFSFLLHPFTSYPLPPQNSAAVAVLWLRICHMTYVSWCCCGRWNFCSPTCLRGGGIGCGSTRRHYGASPTNRPPMRLVCFFLCVFCFFLCVFFLGCVR